MIRKYICTFGVLFISVLIYSQDNNLDYQISSRQLSPQAYQFARYGNIPAKHFVGEPELSIPLYTYQDRDFILPIALRYNGNGFKPNAKEGIIGLDWTLDVGGAITRKVEGLADESISNGFTLGILGASKVGVYKYDIPFDEKIEKETIDYLVNAPTAWEGTVAHNNFSDNKVMSGYI